MKKMETMHRQEGRQSLSFSPTHILLKIIFMVFLLYTVAYSMIIHSTVTGNMGEREGMACKKLFHILPIHLCSF